MQGWVYSVWGGSLGNPWGSGEERSDVQARDELCTGKG